MDQDTADSDQPSARDPICAHLLWLDTWLMDRREHAALPMLKRAMGLTLLHLWHVPGQAEALPDGRLGLARAWMDAAAGLRNLDRQASICSYELAVGFAQASDLSADEKAAILEQWRRAG
jgi:hypothetical protein